MKMPTFWKVAVRVAATGGVLALCAAPATAYASTLNGTATIADPTDSPLASGGSATSFTVTLPAQAACTGDTASSGYHVFSYLVPQGTSPTAVSFTSGDPSTGYGFFSSIGTYYGPANTATTTGQIIGIPDFEWGPAVENYSLLSTLLYNGGTSGVWEAGIACANSSGVVTDYWNTEITFTASQSDPDGFVWADVPGLPTDTPETATTVVLPVIGVGILGGGLWFSRRRSSRKAALAANTPGP
jgi:hypothetical protein